MITRASILFVALLPGCGEDAPPAGGGSGSEGEGDSPLPVGEGEGGSGHGEGEGVVGGEGEGQGEGEGEGPLPPGADGEPCGGASRNECSDGLSCLTCEEANVTSVPDPRSPGDTKSCEGRICTCPQWFAGAWWAEFEPRAVGYEYDFTRFNWDSQMWGEVDGEVIQEGCGLAFPLRTSFFTTVPGKTESKVFPPPGGFWHKILLESVEGELKAVIFTGTISDDHRIITGTCEGEYPDGTVEPTVWFRVTCTFTLTRQQ